MNIVLGGELDINVQILKFADSVRLEAGADVVVFDVSVTEIVDTTC